MILQLQTPQDRSGLEVLAVQEPESQLPCLRADKKASQKALMDQLQAREQNR